MIVTQVTFSAMAMVLSINFIFISKDKCTGTGKPFPLFTEDWFYINARTIKITLFGINTDVFVPMILFQ